MPHNLQPGNSILLPQRPGYTFLVTKVTESHSLLVAADYSDHWNSSERFRQENVLWGHVDVDDYHPGDVIRRRDKIVTLEAGGDVFVIYEYLVIRRLDSGSGDAMAIPPAPEGEAE